MKMELLVQNEDRVPICGFNPSMKLLLPFANLNMKLQLFGVASNLFFSKANSKYILLTKV